MLILSFPEQCSQQSSTHFLILEDTGVAVHLAASDRKLLRSTLSRMCMLSRLRGSSVVYLRSGADTLPRAKQPVHTCWSQPNPCPGEHCQAGSCPPLATLEVSTISFRICHSFNMICAEMWTAVRVGRKQKTRAFEIQTLSEQKGLPVLDQLVLDVQC